MLIMVVQDRETVMEAAEDKQSVSPSEARQKLGWADEPKGKDGETVMETAKGAATGPKSTLLADANPVSQNPGVSASHEEHYLATGCQPMCLCVHLSSRHCGCFTLCLHLTVAVSHCAYTSLSPYLTGDQS